MNDALATVAIVVMAVLTAWQWRRYEVAMRQVESLQAIISLYRDANGDVWGGMDKLSHVDSFAELRENYGAYFDAIPDVDKFVAEQRGGMDEVETEVTK